MLLGRQRWVIFLAPFVVFMLGCTLEPTPEKPGGASIGLAIPYMYYPWLYAAKIALTLAAQMKSLIDSPPLPSLTLCVSKRTAQRL